jgi:hypothetical protein
LSTIGILDLWKFEDTLVDSTPRPADHLREGGSGSMSIDIRQWDYKRCKGMITSFVAQGDGIPERIAKSIRTTIAGGHVARAAVEQMLAETNTETVQPFLGARWNQPERLERFRDIESTLRQTLCL